jgi:chromosome partitioning protein
VIGAFPAARSSLLSQGHGHGMLGRSRTYTTRRHVTPLDEGTPSMARSTRIIAFFNQKGGTAKTTSTLNVAAALAERGRRVLALDMDPQASLTMAIGVDVATLERSIYDLLLEDGLDVEAVARPTTIPGVTLVPSHPDLAAAELELLNVLERERQLDYRLRAANLTAYDYVLIDSPPALNVLSVNILVATGELVVPIEPHPLSLMVLRRLFDTVERIRRLNPDLRVLGFLPTKVHHSSRLAADMLATLAEEFADLALLPAVPLSVKGAESAAERTSILEYMPRSPVAAAYRDVGVWLETHGAVSVSAVSAAGAGRTPLHV